MLLAIGLVYLLMVILFRSLLVPVVILFALPLAVIGVFVALALTGRALDLPALIGMPMLTGIVVTNAIVLLDLAVVTNTTVLREIAQQKIEAGADVRMAVIQSGRTWKRPMLMTAAATILATVVIGVLLSIVHCNLYAEVYAEHP